MSTPEYDIDSEPAATAADWLEVGPEDRHPYGFEPRACVTEISLLPEPEPEAEAGR